MTATALPAIIIAYRQLNPRSRAVGHWTFYGSGGTVRRATCIYCRRIVATCAAAWPITKRFLVEATTHSQACAVAWVTEHVPEHAALLIAVDLDPDGAVRRNIALAALWVAANAGALQ